MSHDRFSRELRRTLALIEEIGRWRPLSPAAREQLDRAARALRTRSNWETDAGRRRIYRAVAEISEVYVEEIRRRGTE